MYNGRHMRLGLCCTFREEQISFKSRQATYLKKFPEKERLSLISTTVLHNATALMQALEFCEENSIGSFRINSKFLPLKAHPELGYRLEELPDILLISELLDTARLFRHTRNIRLTFHPDQFILLSSPRDEVTESSIADLEYHAELAELLGADVITIHGGGAYGDPVSSLARLEKNADRLSQSVRERITLENDDRVYTPEQLLPTCSKLSIPLVYDVHHHRCLKDSLSIDEATAAARTTWDREPLFHLSSPKDGWAARDTKKHHDYIDAGDVPVAWQGFEVTVEVEAKAKELAVRQLRHDLIEKRNAA